MKHFFTSLFVLLVATTFSQTPQIARVSSDGITTVIYTDLKKALSDAQNDDFIYLPAGTFNVDSVIIQKRINIVGTGIYPDSTKATGKTVINGKVYLKAGRDGGSLQGIEFANSGSLGHILTYAAGDFTISKTMFNSIFDGDAAAAGTINIKECVVNGYLYNYNSASNGNLIYNVTNSIIHDNSYPCYYSLYNNCIFLSFTTIAGNYNEYRNCIFHLAGSIGTNQPNRFFNSHIENAGSDNALGNAALNLNTTYDANVNNTFVGGYCPTSFNYTFDFHIKGSSTAASNGTDGTEKGIYGSMNPYNPNPYNPHIYFKSIAPSTNAQGQLQINVKVKAQ